LKRSIPCQKRKMKSLRYFFFFVFGNKYCHMDWNMHLRIVPENQRQAQTLEAKDHQKV
jgi:site-specific recombinase XerD